MNIKRFFEQCDKHVIDTQGRPQSRVIVATTGLHSWNRIDFLSVVTSSSSLLDSDLKNFTVPLILQNGTMECCLSWSNCQLSWNCGTSNEIPNIPPHGSCIDPELPTNFPTVMEKSAFGIPVRGIQIDQEHTVKITQYADDTTVFLKDVQSVHNLFLLQQSHFPYKFDR